MHEYRLPDNMIKPSKSRSSMRLDDWVLCRVRRKDSLPKNIWEDHTSSGSQPPGNYPPSTTADPTFDIIANYRNNGCPMLAYILSSHQGIPRHEANPTSSFQGGRVDNNCVALYEEVCNVGSSPFSPLKRKPMETEIGDDEYGIVHPSRKNVNETTDDLSFCSQYPPHDSIFSPTPSNIYVEFQELNTSAFMGRDLL